MNRIILIAFFTILFFASHAKENDREKGFISVNSQKFIAPDGRQIVLTGINYISKDPREKYMRKDGPDVFEKFRSWGFNCIRLGIIWAGLEPEPGKYNEEYLAEIDKRIQWAADNGIYVFLDMHQDLYGSKFSDGAPEWATLDEGKPHFSGDIWSDSYLISPAVQTAFDNFWNNTPSSDGIGLQDHYANLWKYIAKRYANNTTVIGYDIMNEPFMGTSGNNILPILLTAYAKLMAEETGKNPPSMDEMAAMFDSEESRLKALEFIASKERYKKVIDAAYELNTDFEKNQLQPMYQKVGNAIREVDKNHILFLEHGYFSNPGIASSIEPLKLKDGSTDHLIAYAAHGYDLVVDTKEVENPSYERVGFIFNRINETGKRMNVPVLVGEWGAFGGNSPKLVNPARQILNIFGKYNFSNTYWAFTSDMENLPYFQSALLKPNPVLISGTLIYSDFNFETGKFNCEWTFDSDNKKPSLFYIPNLKKVDIKDITVTPSPVKISLQPLGNSDAGYIVVESKGVNGTCKIDFTVKH